MIYDAAESVRPRSTVRADVCIVGSGAAGLSMAHRLITSGKRVVLLESSRQNHLQKRPPAMHRYLDPDVEKLCEGTLTKELRAVDPTFLTRSRARCYGGTTNCWSGWTRPLSLADFDRRDLDPHFFWPITYQELTPFYNSAIRYCSLGAWDVSAYDDPNFWVGKTTPDVAPLPLGSRSPLRQAVIAVINSANSFRYAFQFVWGPSIEIADNVAIYRNANVRYIVTNPKQNSVVGLQASTVREGKAGHDFTVKADRYVLAAGGIEVARLLLVSNQLGNRHDQVGRFFNIHPVNHDAARFIGGKMPNQSIIDFCSNENGNSLTGTDCPPSVVGILVPTDATIKKERIGNFRGILLFREGRITFTWEQIPNAKSRVTLSKKKDDLFGDPLIAVDLQLVETDLKTIDRGLDIILDELVRLGFAKHYTKRVGFDTGDPGAHHMGTTRMSTDPSHGVVDSNCRVHGVDNLYIASSSVFPTSGFANPTLTIIALGLRLAQHLAELS